MTPDQLHEIYAAAELLDVKPYDKLAAVDRMLKDGRVAVTGVRECQLTPKGERWLRELGQ